ncbi:hypothetical protein GTQ43_21710 [Nostoc sp. KVJ3]|nr:hypothetical protein [Nostoc sp. KVJ3]MCW5316338.1 hypothetical protein [Nostoc sp. KVJ3]
MLPLHCLQLAVRVVTSAKNPPHAVTTLCASDYLKRSPIRLRLFDENI